MDGLVIHLREFPATDCAPADRRKDWLLGSILRLTAWIHSEHRIRRDIRHLHALSDHLLDDIGLTRGSVEQVVRLGRPRAPANDEACG